VPSWQIRFSQITLMIAQINADWQLLSALICGFFCEICEKQERRYEDKRQKEKDKRN
jgi:hypothetical protein